MNNGEYWWLIKIFILKEWIDAEIGNCDDFICIVRSSLFLLVLILQGCTQLQLLIMNRTMTSSSGNYIIVPRRRWRESEHCNWACGDPDPVHLVDIILVGLGRHRPYCCVGNLFISSFVRTIGRSANRSRIQSWTDSVSPSVVDPIRAVLPWIWDW